jgi:hypothetical protein
MTIQEIHEALESGKTVNWVNGLYELHYVNASEENEYAKPTFKNGKAIRVTCVTNYFGSLLREEEFHKCFIKEN